MPLLARTENLQLFSITPADKAQRMQGWGLLLRRCRRGATKAENVWTHHRLLLFGRPREDLRRGRGTLTFEYNTWKTAPGPTKERVTLKAGVRFKIMRGGVREPGLEDEED